MTKRTDAVPELNLHIEYLPLDAVVPDPTNARKHPPSQLARLKAGVSHFGFTIPILIDQNGMIIAGHARLEVAKALGLERVPTIRVAHLSSAQKKALAIADNKLSDLSTFDPAALADQLRALCVVDFNVELTAFATAEIDLLLEVPIVVGSDPADEVPLLASDDPAITQPGDLWLMDGHKLLAGSALDAASYEQLFGGKQAAMVFTDPPYNVKIDGHVSGLGKVRHQEFAMASGEMSSEEFTRFLQTYMTHAARFSADGAVHYHCMDWRHLPEILTAGASAYTSLIAMCVWNKTNAGMGSLYRSKHELVLVYKNGTAPHFNNVNLGRDGRYRTNVWDYAGANAFGRNRDADLAAHPTVKPVALVADAIRDCSRRGDIILDPFAGSGTILLAAERTGRKAAAIELDPRYVDVAVRRWQQRTGKVARLAATGQTFAELAAREDDAPAHQGETAND
jgi:DNA modification methylase